MSTNLERIKEIEEEMARTQKNKATSKHLGLLKARLAKLKSETLIGSKKGGPVGEGFDVTKSGDARVGLVGFPSVGKSTLLTKLTDTESLIAAYEFTTLTCIPGVIQYKGAKIQLLDLPGIIEGAKDGKGRGRQVIGVARTCDLILMVLDVGKPATHKHIISNELEGFGIRLNQTPPNIHFKKRERGGLNYVATVPQTYCDQETVKAITSEYKVPNCDVTLRCNATIDQLIDVIEGNRVYMPCIYVLNKIDSISIEELDLYSRIEHCCPISSDLEWNLDSLLEMIWEHLDMIRIYTKPKGQIPDYTAPVVLRKGKRTVDDFCRTIHRSLSEQFKFAKVWGASARHNPQVVGKEHILMDEDVVQVIKN